MRPSQDRELRRRFRQQYGLIVRSEARLLGVTEKVERGRVASGEWDRPAPNVIRATSAPQTPEQDLLIACFRCGPSGIASHVSAAWLWGLTDRPVRHSIIVHRLASARHPGVDVHRPRRYPCNVSMRSGIPCTNPLRTLVDLAAVAPARVLDDAIDRALAKRLVTIEAISAERARLARPGRAGVGVLSAALTRRGYVGSPYPSVLESKALRLLHHAGIRPLGTEVRCGPHGEYQLDITLTERVSVEVDGRAFHENPEQTEEDERRRHRIRQGGAVVLVYTWRAIVFDGRRVISEVRAEIDAHREEASVEARLGVVARRFD